MPRNSPQARTAIKTNECCDVNMDERERQILLLIITVVVYCLYNYLVSLESKSSEKLEQLSVINNSEETAKILETVNNDETKITTKLNNVNTDIKQSIKEKVIPTKLNNVNTETKQSIKEKVIPLYMKNACSILQIFTIKPAIKRGDMRVDEDNSRNAIAVIGITIFLIILTINAVLDVIKVKEEERARRNLNPGGERRPSLSEFANKKPFRRESSKFGFQLFQIAETPKEEEEKKDKRRTKQYKRGDSTNSYLSDKKTQRESAPASIGDTSEPKLLVKRQSVAKLIGARPAPMVRRSSFPVLPLNPDIQAMMLGHRQASVDSDDEDGRGRRVRLIRRF